MTALYYNVGGTNEFIKQFYYNVNGTWKAIKMAYYKVGGTWYEVFAQTNSPSISVTSTNPYSNTVGTSTAGSTSHTFTTNTTGGTSPYTYSWVRTSGSSFTASTTNTSSLQLNYTYTQNQGGLLSDTWQVTVTDQNGLTATASVTWNLTLQASTLSVSIPATAAGTYSTNEGGGTASVLVSSTVSGGASPFTYAWTFVSNPSNCTFSSYTAANPYVTYLYAYKQSSTITARVNVTVTDSVGNKATSNNCNVTITLSG